MNKKEARALLKMPLLKLLAKANKARASHNLDNIQLCSIMNAKSGLCSEDCKFCAQSCRHNTGIGTFPLKGVDDMLKAARRAKKIGAQRFGIVTSGNRLSKDELQRIAEAIALIKSRLRIKVCASLGKLDEKELFFLKKAGLTRYHHNIETSPAYFKRITTTHTFQDRLDTIRAAGAVGLEVCSGGIIGLGESWNDRIEMAFMLKSLDVTSVPINFLLPIKGTLLENKPVVSGMDAVRTIALFRIILPDKTIKVAAGRESLLKDFQALAFMAGANSMLIGGYLTTGGRPWQEDKLFCSEVERLWKA